MEDDKPFDATESYLCDAPEATMGKWRTTSLVTALKGILERRPQFEQSSPGSRSEAFRATADELTRRGLDALSLVRYGMWDTVASSVVTVLTQSAVVSQDRPGGMSRSDADAWWAALDLAPRPSFSDTPAPAEVHTMLTEIVLPSMPRLMNWISAASIDDLLDLAAPSDVISDDPRSENLDDELHAQYAWAVDHFSSTFYSEWSTSSLHCAYRWLSGHEIPPCRPELMNDRRIDPAQLNAEIARRAATRRNQPARRPRIDTLLANEMVHYATSLLNDRRYREAAAIFKFAASQKPYDGHFWNNLGFCLIPEDPLEALGYLRTAADMSYPRPSVNIYNQMCCYIALRRSREALAIASAAWPSIRSNYPSGATLWKLDDATADWVIFETDDDRLSVTELAMALAHGEGWPAEEKEWRDRQEELAS